MYSGERLNAYMRTRRAEWKAHGRCSICGGRIDDWHKTCERCRRRARDAMRRKAAERGKIAPDTLEWSVEK